MPIQQVDDTLAFKKYSLKLFKDVLVYSSVEKAQNISRITNESAAQTMQRLHPFSAGSLAALESITRYDKNYTHEEMAHLLTDYESIVERLCIEKY
jgi:hypothetical protein